MNDQLRQKLAKIYELVKRGTAGEQAAAKRALDRMIDKYGLDGVHLESLDINQCYFKYSTMLELDLLKMIIAFFVEAPDFTAARRQTGSVRQLKIGLRYLEYVTVNCAYEYFRRHMKAQWKKSCEPVLTRCRSAKTRAKRKAELQEIFFSQYLIMSGLVKEDWIRKLLPEEMNKKDLAIYELLSGVEGGRYNRQLSGGLLLDQAPKTKTVQQSLF